MKLWQEHIDDIISEKKITSQTRVSRTSKIKRDIGARAVRLAKEKNDSGYKRMKYHLELYTKFKRQLIKKYGNRVKQQARI